MTKSISGKIGLIIVIVLLIALITVFSIMLIKSESNMMETAEKNVNDINTLITNSLLFAVSEEITSVDPYIDMLKDIPELKEVRLIPSDAVTEDSEISMDPQEKEVFKSKQPVFKYEDFQNSSVIRGIRTIDAQESCLDCHEANIGDPLAMLSIRYSIDEAESTISTQRFNAILGIILTVSFSFLIIKFLIDKKVIGRLFDLIDNIKLLAKGNIKFDVNSDGEDEIAKASETQLICRIDFYNN